MPMMDETRGLYMRLLAGWNARNAAAMAECFRADGVMIGFDGSLADGRTAIRDHLAPIFADHPTASFTAIVRSVRESGSSSILLADVGMIPPGSTALNPATLARQTVVADRDADGSRRVALFQNTPAALHADDAGRQALSDELSAAYAERGLLPD